MKQNYLNTFVPIVRNGNEYIFGVDGVFLGDDQDKMVLSKEQQMVLEQMVTGSSISDSALTELFGKERYEKFVQKGIFVPIKPRTDYVFSRTDQFYKINRLGNMRNVLSKKKILILGCGGIGTHVAWNMVTAGIGELILLDFDKIENSNLNRQLLYNIDDIGCYKIEVLKEKLQKINIDLKVITVNRKIESKEDLDEVCSDTCPDLIIKSLDSPEEFPFYLDDVCMKYKIPYISGTSASTHAVIGPTYIPGESAGYTEFFIKKNNIAQHVSGLLPSLSLVMYDASNEISIEAFKILTKIGKLKFYNKMIFKNVVTGDYMELAPNDSKTESSLIQKRITHTHCLIAALMFLIFALTIQKFEFVWLGALFLCIAPVCIFSERKYAVWSAFQNVSWYMLMNFMVAVIHNKVFLGRSFLQIISMILTLFIEFSFAIFICLIVTEVLFGIKSSLQGGK